MYEKFTKIFSLLFLLLLPFSGFAGDVAGDGCTLKFKDGTEVKDVMFIQWAVNKDGAFIYDSTCNEQYFRDDHALKNLVSVNRQPVNGNDFMLFYGHEGDRDWYWDVYFYCKKFGNGKYFAYDCKNHEDDDDKAFAGVKVGDTTIFQACFEPGHLNIFDLYDTCSKDNRFVALDGMLNKYFDNSSVWKNDEGGFNTARLASDSIAGVILGTTGGIVTSKIIKKNQIKSGFESLKCTIGGQDVANFGDEFKVGVK